MHSAYTTNYGENCPGFTAYKVYWNDDITTKQRSTCVLSVILVLVTDHISKEEDNQKTFSKILKKGYWNFCGTFVQFVSCVTYVSANFDFLRNCL